MNLRFNFFKRNAIFDRMEIPILFQDDDFIIVNKPVRILVHPSYYARNIEGPSLVELLENQLGNKYHPVHRLDYKTSGVLILSQDPKMVANLQAALEENKIEKEYLALLRGHTPIEGEITSPVKNADTGVYKDAHTDFKTLISITVPIAVEPYPQSRYSLVQFYPKTGRMHQLRKHANKISHPIVGDYKYGNRHHNVMFVNELGIQDMFLHANSLKFNHPITGRSHHITAPLPSFWHRLMEHTYFTDLQPFIVA